MLPLLLAKMPDSCVLAAKFTEKLHFDPLAPHAGSLNDPAPFESGSVVGPYYCARARA